MPGEGIDAQREPPLTANWRLTEFGVFRDAAPDRWGRRVIENKLRRVGPLPESEYLRQAGSSAAQVCNSATCRSTSRAITRSPSNLKQRI
ncbi:hypothetical protein C0V76_14920 [Uliginosibacterium sp. TH139]|nr:hypothetical protein C0V76_14920 [Uliginosibacterium sp. TH139]